MNQIEKDNIRLLQANTIDLLTTNLKITDMLTVYYSDYNGQKNHGIYCALVPSDKIKQVLSNTSWSFSHECGLPGSVKSYDSNCEIVKYYRFGNDDDIEPLIIDREFSDIYDSYREISEEFRLFHRLYHDRKSDKYIKVEDDGSETLVATVEENRIQIRLKEIRQFLAIREMHLLIQFDCREHSIYTLKELNLKKDRAEYSNELTCYGLYFGEFGALTDSKSFSRLLGKHLIKPLPKSKSGLWGFDENDKKSYVDFVIGATEDGDDITHTSNPDLLANYFGANPEAPNFLTPVYFKKQVLDKYYQQPSKYSVGDSYIRCGSLWGLQIDNHHNDKVCVWLGDLGQTLSYSEQLYWRSFNIEPQGGVSSTYFKRQILAQFTDSSMPEHLFTDLYRRLEVICVEHLGWQILLPLNPEDEHYLKCIRIPTTNEQRDFDELILALTKILIDSLNEIELKNLSKKYGLWSVNGGISHLEAAMKAVNADGFEEHILFLRKLQSLRSSGVAHRKGSNYKKASEAFGLDEQNLSQAFTKIIEQASSVLEFMTEVVQCGFTKVE